MLFEGSGLTSAPSALSPLSCSQSGDEAPLHSLRGPNTGDTCPKPSRDPEPGSWSRSGQTERDSGDEEEEEEEGYGQEEESRGYEEEEEEEEEVYGQGRSRGADVELMLQMERVSGSSSDGEPVQLSSKFIDIIDMPSDSILKFAMSSVTVLSSSAPTPRPRGPMADSRRRAWISSEMVSRLRRAVRYSALAWVSLA